ncbi:MAG TPA: 30S ribosomal protein S4 [Patescibacteria group bacterium]|nr:30S ribosomal protein S4 [Patescibacteria group bacterium]
MARYTGPKRRLSRRAGLPLFGKDEKFLSLKGAVAPGQHGNSRRKKSDYALQLMEKQKAKWMYGVMEKQFQRYFDEAARVKGATGEALLQKLETRLDNIVFRLGLAKSRNQARQFVTHGNVLVGGNKLDIPSYNVRTGEEITLLKSMLENPHVKEALEQVKPEQLPAWLKRKGAVGKLVRIPSREDITTPIDEQLIVEYYSR